MRPFEVSWTASQVDDLRSKVAAVVLPPAPPDAGWSLGCERSFLERFQRYWVEEYDWRGAMADLNRYPQFIAEIDGLPIHFVHVRGEGAGARAPLILTHGWPGSHFEFWAAAERLAFPSRHGGSPDDALDLVIPSLPGYAFSGKPLEPTGPRAVAGLWNTLMTRVLGYERYLAQGGDFGGVVTSFLGLDHPATVKAIHVNMLGLRSAEPPQNDAEAAWNALSAQTQQRLSGYASVHMMKPLSIGWATAGSPLGQAAWILERFHDWADLDQGGIEAVFGLDHLVTSVMLYAMTDSLASSVWLYHGLIREGGVVLPKGTRCETPTAYAAFPKDAVLPTAPRSRAELVYNLVRWTEMPRGGHFAAMEQPALFADDVASWAREAWRD